MCTLLYVNYTPRDLFERSRKKNAKQYILFKYSYMNRNNKSKIRQKDFLQMKVGAREIESKKGTKGAWVGFVKFTSTKVKEAIWQNIHMSDITG